MKNLNLYTVHLRRDVREPCDEAIFVRESFHWPAFFFGPFWTLYQRLWLPTLFLVLWNGGVMWMEEAGIITENSSLALGLAAHVVVGLQGGDWLRARLSRRGYTTAGIVSGETRLLAERRFFEDYLATHPTTTVYT